MVIHEEIEENEISDGVIIYELFDIRQETFEDDVRKKNKDFFNEEGEIGSQLEELIEKNIKSISEILSEWLTKITEECEFWKKCYYQKGIVDSSRNQKYSFKIDKNIFEKKILQVTKEKMETDKMRKKLINLICKNMKNDNIRDKILLQMDKMRSISEEIETFWKEKYYRKGYCDILQLKKEVAEYQF